MPITSIDFSNASPNEWDPTNQGTDPDVTPYSRVDNGVWTFRPQSTTFAGGPIYVYKTVFSVTNTSTSNFTISIEDVTGTPFIISSITGTGTLTRSQSFLTAFPGAIRKIKYRVTSQDPTITFIPTIDFKYQLLGTPEVTTRVTGTDIAPNGAVTNIVVADQVPDIKIIDFLTGIFKMFNLTAFVQNDG